MQVISVFLSAAAICFAQTSTGIEQYRRGDYTGAIKTLSAADRSDTAARTFLSLARASTGECAAVTADLESVYRATTANTDLRRLAGIGLVQCLIAANRTDEAVPLTTEMRREFPSDADVLYQAAKLYMHAWNDVVQQMFRTGAASWRVNQLSAEVFETQGKYADAASEYRKAIAKNAAAVNLHYRLARSILAQSHGPEALAEAQREFEAELKLNPNDAVAQYQIAQILTAGQQSDLAAQRLERAIAIDPRFAEAQIGLAKLRLAGGHTEDAIRLLKRAVELQPNSEAGHYNLMVAYRKAGRIEDARKQNAELEKLQRPPEGEFTDFLKRLGDKPPQP
jgi:tetratricopeptide (TPR) repeat protein